MKFEMVKSGSVPVAIVLADKKVLTSTQDAVDMMATAQYEGADALVVEEEHCHEDFFDLKSKIAGDILQKYTTYGMKLAIVGEFDKFKSKSLRDFIYECNKGNHIFFADSRESALVMIAK